MIETPCPKCEGAGKRTVFVGKDHLHKLPGEYKVVECEDCGMWFLNPRPEDEDLSGLYPADYSPHVMPAEYVVSDDTAARLAQDFGYDHLARPIPRRQLLEPLDRARFKWKAGVGLLPDFVSDGSVLDIGAASGSRLLELRALGWTKLHGIELVPAAAERARSRGLDVRCGSVEDTLDSFKDNSLDVIVTNMVLEHLHNPFDIVRRISSKLRPGGQFLFSTITRDSLDAKVFGDYWAGYDFPRHLVYLRDADIEQMIQGRFETVGRYHHAAAQDFVRPATWRAHEGRWLDRVILGLNHHGLRYRAALLIAWAGLSCRVSYRCRANLASQRT